MMETGAGRAFDPRSLVKLLAAVCLGLLAVNVVDGAEPSKPVHVLLLSGQNNHDWQRTTPKIKSLLEADGTIQGRC